LTNITQRQPGPSVSRRERAHAAPDSERRVALRALLERRRQDRQRGRKHHRGADALGEAGADQHALALGESADQRRNADQHGPGDEDAAAPEQVGGPAAEQHEAAVGEEIGAGDPLQALDREAQVAADRWQCDVDDRRVDEVEERDRGQQGERELAATSREEG
jgi:hypothetical protein